MASSSISIKMGLLDGDLFRLGETVEENAEGNVCVDVEESCNCSVPSYSNRRFDKGHLSYTLPRNYVVIDLETTGLSPSCDEIIEYAAVKVVNDEIVSTFQELAKPTFPISPIITNITGITNEMLASARPTSEVYKDYINFIGRSVLVGHNVNFDINFLYDYGQPQTTVSNNYIDTLRLAKLKVQGLECYKLAFLCDTFGLNDEDGYHRALFDCYQTNKLYQFLKSDLTDSDWMFLRETRKPSSTRRNYRQSIDFKALTATIPVEEIDKDNPFYGKEIVFTGALERFERKVACQIVVNLGGIPKGGITKKTDFLVLGNNDYCRSITNPEHKSSKQLKAEAMMESGGTIRIIPEDVFYDMIEDD